MLEKLNLKKTPIEEMSDHEILLELIKDKRRNDRNRYIKNTVRIIIAIAVIVLLIIVVPPVVRFFRQLNETITQMQESIAQVTEVAEGVRTQVEDSLAQIEDFTDEAKVMIEDSIGEISTTTEEIKAQVEDSLEEFSGLYDELKVSVDQIGTDGLESIKEAAEKLNALMDGLPFVFK